MKKSAVYSKEDALIQEGFELDGNHVWAYNQKYPIVDPLAIHLKNFRSNPSHDTRLKAMRRSFEIMWPAQVITYNYWMDRIFSEITNHETEIFSLAGGGGIGKALDESIPVRTPLGWVKIKDLKAGDTISAIDGSTQRVLGVYPQGIRPVYKISFTDHTYTFCDEEHLWTVYSAKQRDRRSGPQTITTRQLKENLTKDFSLPNFEALAGVEQSFNVHPYILGVLLGNGSLSTHSVSASISNVETLEEINKHWKDISIKWIPDNSCWRVGFLGIRKIFRNYSVSNNKSIPPEYLYASIEQRICLLQGLMDTDGYCSKDGTAQYTTVSPQLKEDVVSLARSLGFLVTVSSKIPSYTHKGEKRIGQQAFTISIRRTSTTRDMLLFRVPHKELRSNKPRKQYYHKKIKSVEYVYDAKTVCIKVSNPNNLFFVNDYIVTHNTQSMAYGYTIAWAALPDETAIIVTSTDLPSLRSRIYGYMLRAIKECVVPIPFDEVSSPPPAIHPVPRDFIHGIYGLAAKQGDDDTTIKSIIGRHPLDSLFLCLDEGTDMPIAILKALDNLKKGLKGRFQAACVGNSKSWSDLHGIVSTPEKGIENLDPYTDFRWKTTQPGGICLYFNPYDSPAIHETDPVKKKALSVFLMNEEKLIKAEREEGVDSEGFWRFTMGFWRTRSTDPTIVSEAFLKDYDPTTKAEFSGKVPLKMVAGLDPAFSVGGDKCILRLAVLGQHTNGYTVLDFKGTSLVFEIKIKANTGKSAEIQIAEEVIRICEHYNIPLGTLCVDASGQGRGLADVIQLKSGGAYTPTKIYSTNIGVRTQKSFDVVISSAHEMWFKGREFISNRQIHGLDSLAYAQLHNRLIVAKKGGKDLLETKPEYKKRMGAISSLLGRSPDEADAAMLALQSAILHHGFYPGQRTAKVEYETQDHENYAKALEAYKAKMKENAFVLKAKYSHGISSLIGKKMF